ncbi:MAG: bifunctional UDP-N-acetylmuramoyl-tripeptide:D-alanyl-D-alanine ligase/alanine racemase [Bacteroidia bacterium]|nr:MAG: bifunctional UDP-N-acetylmuramoyl-tripeptide:D-alanyl-D-alanine ligase/alanine racemase [Bacteroidia bacterium]
MNYSLQDIADIVGGKLLSTNCNKQIQTIYIDTRQIALPENALFVAIETPKNDGHRYLKNAYEKGVKCFLVQYIPDNTNFEDACFIIVKNTIRALQRLAHYHRSQFNIPVIGITGSNGKTIVKEWLYFLLKDYFTICRSPKSFNSQIGVPLSVLNLNSSHTLAIIEAGISDPNEMEYLQSIIQPTIGIFTHFGSAHSENFESDEEKLNEKLKLFQSSKINIVQRFQNKFLQDKNFPINYKCISELEKDYFFVEKINKYTLSTSISVRIDNEFFQFAIPFIDDASIKNAITCLACIYVLDKTILPKLLNKFLELPPISLRLEIKKGKYQAILISDYYNSDIDSFEIAMSYFHQYPETPKVLILSDFDQIKNTDEIYSNALKIIHQYHLKQSIFIGEEWKEYLHKISVPYAHYLTTADFIEQVASYSDIFFKSVVLIKGARKFEFEKIAQYLELKSHDTILEINIPSLWHNLMYYKNLIGKQVQMMCMIKASGYGSGSIELAYALQRFGVDYLAVAYADEGVELRQAKVSLPIMVMLPEKQAFQDIIQHQLEPEIYSFEILNVFVEELKKQGINRYPVHIKFDTGMHRLGFLPDETPELINYLTSCSNIVVKSIFSHFAASESDLHKDYTLHQIQLFKDISTQVEQALNYKVIKHICNSAAIKRFPEGHFDMVRIGIGMYGISDDAEEQKQLQNVLKLKTKVEQIKHLKKGESVGYSRSVILSRDSKIAVIPVGYADGFFRKLGNGKFMVKFKDNFISTIGNVCMDMSFLDVTDVEVTVGDEIIIFNTYDDIKRMAETCGTIPYEILTSISQRVKRVYVYE